MDIRKNWILVSLMLTTMLAAMDTTIISTAIAQVVSDLGGFEKFSWVFSIYLLAQTVTIPIYGKLADVFGRKPILVFGIIVFLLGSAASGFAWDIVSLIVFRGLQGLGAGSIMATVNTIAGDIYTIRERAKIQGLLGTIWGISAIMGPAIGGAFVEYANWRWIFFINIPIGIIAIIFLTVFLKEKSLRKKPKIDYLGSTFILLTVGLLILYLLETGQSWPLLSLPGIGIPILVLILGMCTVHIERRAPEPILPSWLLKNKTFMLTSLTMLGMGLTMMAPGIFLPTFAQASLNVGAILSGLILAGMSLGWPTASALSGHLYMRIGFRKTAMLGAFMVIGSGIGFLMIPWPQSIWLIFVSQIFLGAGFGFISTSSLVGVQSMVNWERRGVATSSIVFTRNLGQSLGAAIFGAIFNYSFAHQTYPVKSELPLESKEILNIIQDPILTEPLKLFLQKSLSISIHHVYYALVLFGILTLFFIFRLPERGKPEEPAHESR